MRLSAVLALAIAAPALAKSVHNVYPVLKREDSNKDSSKDSKDSKDANNKNDNSKNNGNNGQNIIVQAQTTQIIILWNNPGNGAATTTINQAVTVTQTVTAGAAATTVVGSATVAPGATSVVAGTGATHSVIVGGPGGLAFSPAEVKAAVGDSVVFTFMSNNHTATQSAFAAPCDPLAGGMDSGFVPNVNNTINPPPQVAMQVMVATPLWFYCKQANHCGAGMTFSINPTADKTQAIFQAMAIAQKGKGSGSAITGGTAGNGTAAAPAAAPAAGASSAVASAAPAATGSIQQGLGTLQPGTGQCVCAVSCGAGAFPAAQAQGVGAFNGFAGALPAAMVEA
ncbi:hypothetical protein BKA67DRAFT_166801 [Truncatella angustata]|uniref:Serine-threonine rich protein n=1 Tax=Truncatella angustata TaxID=152316 RepID=A0A9P9A065_9PEZI|nr:uncharacterized protein BKA67DRAFT_166801 [Truncatella angustata]KAH6656749.1 hypothetical protein BKA67DRAFT_166801 [Truncatella angustata]KAH8200464.1 hypothetical protein TruAng_005357 [Truncatella angustata]